MFFLNCLFGNRYLENPNLCANIPRNAIVLKKTLERRSQFHNKTPCKMIHHNSLIYYQHYGTCRTQGTITVNFSAVFNSNNVPKSLHSSAGKKPIPN